MPVILAKSAGFCFGVDRAVSYLLEKCKTEKISTYGPIIHNKNVVDRLKKNGVESIDNIDDLKEGYKLAIRTHGVGKDIIDTLEKKGVEYIDLTCPYVKKIHKIVSENHKNGKKIVIVGDREHPEVIGINGWCEGSAFITTTTENIEENIKPTDDICIVSQTTLDRKTFEKITNFSKNYCQNTKVFDTICKATSERQAEAAEISKKSDVMIVVGGKNSSNTNKLADICKIHCKNTFKVESFEEIPQDIDIPKNKVGITAGASTPLWIIKEVVSNMTEKENGVIDFAKEFEEYEKSLITLNTGDIVKGTVIRVQDNGVSVNLGYKSDGFVPATEMTDDPSVSIYDMVKPGDEIEVFVVRVSDVEGEVTLSKKKIDSIRNASLLEEAFESKEILEGKVIDAVNGGVIVLYKGMRIFVPASQASDRFLSDLSLLVGTEVKFRIIDISKRRGRNKVVGSIKSVLKEEKNKLAEEFWASAEVGKKYEGIVKSLTSFGAFVDVGGVDGLVHISELSWAKIKHPSEVVKVGDAIEVYIIECDKESGKISLGFKKVEDNPWEKAKAELELDKVVEAKIVRIVPFGAFAQIFPGVDGLIHISQVANKRIGKVEDELTVGQYVQAKIVELDLEKQKIGLSIRALLAPEAPAEEVVEETAPVAEEVAEAVETVEE